MEVQIERKESWWVDCGWYTGTSASLERYVRLVEPVPRFADEHYVMKNANSSKIVNVLMASVRWPYSKCVFEVLLIKFLWNKRHELVASASYWRFFEPTRNSREVCVLSAWSRFKRRQPLRKCILELYILLDLKDWIWIFDWACSTFIHWSSRLFVHDSIKRLRRV